MHAITLLSFLDVDLRMTAIYHVTNAVNRCLWLGMVVETNLFSLLGGGAVMVIDDLSGFRIQDLCLN